MNRPVYETDADRQREKELADLMAKHWGVTAKPNPKMYPIDYTFVGDYGEVEGFGEIKIRRNTKEKYPTYMISAHKVADAKKLAEATGRDVILIVKWSCGSIGYLDLANTPADSVHWGGRSDRGDGQDMEPVCHFNIENFLSATKGENDGEEI